MKRTTLHYRVGLVLVALSLAFAGLVTFILGGGGGRAAVHYLIAFDENVKGMVVGSKVNFQGVPAGVVSDIRFRDGQALVQITVAADRGFVQDVTQARLDRLLVTGQVSVELEGFERGRGRLPAGSFITPRPSPIGELSRSIPEVVGEVPAVLRGIGALAASLQATLDAPTRAHAQAVLANLDRITARLVPVVDAGAEPLGRAMAAAPVLVDRMAATLDEFARTAAEVRALAAGDDTRAAVRDLAGVAARLDELAGSAEALIADLRSLVGGTRGSWAEALAGVRDAMRDLRGLAHLLQLAPSSLLYGRDIAHPAAPPRMDK